MSTSPRIMLMAGGTGGHIFPALAVAQFMQDLGWQTRWLGSANGMEESIVPDYGIEIDSLPVSGVRGKSLMTRLLSPFMSLQALWNAIKFMRRFKPDVVLGMGGFASGPGGIAAWLLRYPLCIHEQNAIAGMTNRWLAKFARYRLVAFPGGLQKADADIGNPVRKDILEIGHPDERFTDRTGPLRILIVGGSRGAAVLNEVVPTAIANVADNRAVDVMHQTGAGNQSDVQTAYETALDGKDKYPGQIDVREFISDMQAAYNWADLVICRAGALTVSEIAAAGLAAIFVPFPHAVDDHQTVNADYLVHVGAAYLMPQTELTASRLSDEITKISRADCHQMALLGRAQAKPNATRDLAKYCMQAAGYSLTGAQL